MENPYCSLTAAIPVENIYCSCKLLITRSWPAQIELTENPKKSTPRRPGSLSDGSAPRARVKIWNPVVSDHGPRSKYGPSSNMLALITSGHVPICEDQAPDRRDGGTDVGEPSAVPERYHSQPHTSAVKFFLMPPRISAGSLHGLLVAVQRSRPHLYDNPHCEMGHD